MSIDIFKVKEHIIPAQHIREYPGATAETQEHGLKLHIKQYTPLLTSSWDSTNAVTIIAAHANGFPKELYEPLWDDLFELSRNSFRIRNIWIADVAHQGQSSVLNEDVLGNEPSWYDHPRDLLLMVNHFREHMSQPIFGIGHSMGGQHLVNLSLMHPRLFAGLVLIDPVMKKGSPFPYSSHEAPNYGVATASSHRKDLWPSRRAAAISFGKIPVYQRWDRRVYDLWIQYGLRDLPTAVYPDPQQRGKGEKPVTLTTTKHQEVWTYLRPNFGGQDSGGQPVYNRKATPDILPDTEFVFPFYRAEGHATFLRLPNLRPPTFFILGELSDLGPQESQRDHVKVTGTGLGGSGGLTEGRVRDIILPGIGHLMPMEAPGTCAKEIADWLFVTLGGWLEDEKVWRKSREGRPRTADLVLSQQWMKHIGNIPSRIPKKMETKL